MKLNTLDGYLESIRGMSIPQDAVFRTNPSLTEKVGPLTAVSHPIPSRSHSSYSGGAL